MFKPFKNFISGLATNAKCGEIFCQSARSFTIICSFCDMKTFEFEDFLLHFRNVHFENNLLKAEEMDMQSSPYLDITVKNEPILEEDQNQLNCAGGINETYDVDEDENLLKIWQHNTKKKKNYKRSGNKEDHANENADNVVDENNEDEDFKPRRKNNLNDIAPTHKCEACKKTYKSLTYLRMHIKKMHSESTTTSSINCPVCAVPMPSHRFRDEHCKQEHGGVPCNHCEKKFATSRSLHFHLSIHADVKNFACEFANCGKKYFSRKSLWKHNLSHTNNKQFMCETCGYSCYEKQTLRVHRRIHTGEKPYACELCEKRFPSASQLNEHRASHTSLRTHVCDVCGASFTRPKSLYHHKHLHLGVKKFVCKLCGNAYAQAAGLAGHMRKHREEGHL